MYKVKTVGGARQKTARLVLVTDFLATNTGSSCISLARRDKSTSAADFAEGAGFPSRLNPLTPSGWGFQPMSQEPPFPLEATSAAVLK